MRILVIEDQPPVAGALRRMLEARNYAVDVAHDGETGLDLLLRDLYDAAIVDVMLPKRDGFSIAQEARRNRVQTPIVMLTALDAVEDRVGGLDAGADDYLVKPFREEELLARLRAITRRAARPISETIAVGDLRIDPAARAVSWRGEQLDLAATEFRLIEFLARNSGIAFSRAHLIERVWEYDFDGSPNIVDVYVSQIRRKLKRAGAPDPIATVWGVGYKFRA